MRIVCEDLLRRPAWKYDLVVGLACFDFFVLFELPKSQSTECFKQFSKGFSDRQWIARENRGLLKDCNMEIIDDLRSVLKKFDEAGNGVEVDNMIALLGRSPELERRKHTCLLFERFCLFLPHSTVCIPHVGVGSGNRRDCTVDLTLLLT